MTQGDKGSFFKQSGWLLIGTGMGGVFMYAVHIFAGRIQPAEYGVFVTLLQILNLMGIPAIGLQTVFAHQTASAITEQRRHQLTATIRGVLLGITVVWAITAAGILMFQQPILAALKISNPAALWATLVVALALMWHPVGLGLLQGKQSFMWLGWTYIANGLGRLIPVMLVVLVFGGHAAGSMVGVLIGVLAAVVIGLGQSRDLWTGPTEPFDWRGWFTRVVPLTLGLGVGMFMLGADMIVVQSTFDKDLTGAYGAAGMIGRGLVFFTVPLTAVMFPKVVQSAARSEKTDVLAQALGATAVMGGLAAIACTLLPELPLRIVYSTKYLDVAPLVRWFAWCMLPLTLANVLINNLLARQQFAVVPWLVLVAIGYGVALNHFNTSFESVVKTLGIFNLLLVAVSAWFTWGRPHRIAAVPSPGA
ncbi:MAG: hypothetical protein AB1705_03675 [Verrucomicrobiota bacterium]